MNELADVIERFNYYMGKFSKNLGAFISVQQFFPDSQEKLNASIQRQSVDIESLLSQQSSEAAVRKYPALKAALDQVHRQLAALKEHIDVFASLISLQRYSAVSSDPATEEKERGISETHIQYSYIRPLIFLFIMANSFSNSFFPMYADTFYEPLWGLSREVIIGLPLSLYMFFLAITMPFAGSWSDRIGWHKPLMISILFNAAGLILTGMAQNMSQLLGFYSISAVGFAILVISSQQFVIDNTTARDRTLGLAAFIVAFFSGDICGTVVGGMLANRIGYRNVFLVSGLIALSAFICGLIIFKKEFRKAGKKKKIPVRFSLKDVFRVLRDRDFFAVVFLQAIPAKLVLVGFLYYFIPLYLKRIGALQSDIGRVLMCYGVILVFLSPLFSKFLDRESYRKYYIFAGGMITGVSMVSFYFYSGFLPILFIVAMIGLAHTFSVSSQASFITETAIVKKMGPGTGMGIFRFWERVGNVAGPLLMGFLIAKVGYEQSVAVLGLISFVCSLLYFLMITLQKRKLK